MSRPRISKIFDNWWWRTKYEVPRSNDAIVWIDWAKRREEKAFRAGFKKGREHERANK